jgi:hypothetical protein
MKALAWILLGLLTGSFATVSALNALRPATAFPRGVMALFQHHLGSARDQVTAGRCDATLASHFEALDVLARDVRPAFSALVEHDQVFARYADKLAVTTSHARALDLSDCRLAAEQVSLIGDGCKACHREYK